MKEISVGLDIDGVIYPYHDVVYRYFTEEKGYTNSYNHFWTVDWWLLGKEKQDYIVSLPFLYYAVIPSSCVMDSLNKLATLGKLFYITSRSGGELESVTQKFFNFFDPPFKQNLLFEHDKATACRLYSIDYFLDDFPEHVSKLEPVTNAYLMNQAHNIGKREGYKTVSSLKEFYEVIKNDITPPRTAYGTSTAELYDFTRDDLNFDASRESRMK